MAALDLCHEEGLIRAWCPWLPSVAGPWGENMLVRQQSHLQMNTLALGFWSSSLGAVSQHPGVCRGWVLMTLRFWLAGLGQALAQGSQGWEVISVTGGLHTRDSDR